MPDTAKFCSACGSKPIATDSETAGTVEVNETVENVKWYRRNDTQAKNLTVLITGLANLFNPYAKLGDISVNAMSDWIGLIMFLVGFYGMYLNYIKKFKPLVFIFGFLALCSLLILVIAADYPDLNVQYYYYVPALMFGAFTLGAIESYKEGKK
jgi:hypothetical protein